MEIYLAILRTWLSDLQIGDEKVTLPGIFSWFLLQINIPDTSPMDAQREMEIRWSFFSFCRFAAESFALRFFCVVEARRYWKKGTVYGCFTTPLEHTPKPLPTGYKGIPFIVGQGDFLGCALGVCCNFRGYAIFEKNHGSPACGFFRWKTWLEFIGWSPFFRGTCEFSRGEEVQGGPRADRYKWSYIYIIYPGSPRTYFVGS